MDCSICNLGIINNNYITSSNKYHYKCLFRAQIMKKQNGRINHYQNMLFNCLDHNILYLNVIHVYIIIIIRQ